MKEQRHFLIAQAAQILRKAGIPEERREAASLLGHVLGRDRTYILTRAEQPLNPANIRQLRDVVTRRAAGEPFQYIAGHQEFYSLDFEVTPDVLIPRPETELLVEQASALLRQSAAPPTFCEVGVGSGCVAISLLHENPSARAVGLDISPAALQVAGRNAARHLVTDRLELLPSDGFSALAPGRQFTLIVSNPPYIAAEALAGLQREVRDYEPHIALTPGPDGLTLIRRLLEESPAFLPAGGHLLLEIGFDQADAVRTLVNPKIWQLTDIYRDLQGHPRTAVLRKHAFL
jgi:release factor glutamine methyltransferase